MRKYLIDPTDLFIILRYRETHNEVEMLLRIAACLDRPCEEIKPATPSALQTVCVVAEFLIRAITKPLIVMASYCRYERAIEKIFPSRSNGRDWQEAMRRDAELLRKSWPRR